jgi:hypothetical protein
MNEIYMRLMDEGTEVFRPVRVKLLEGSLYQIDESEVPEDERWEFEPGEIVSVRLVVTESGSEILVASPVA